MGVRSLEGFAEELGDFGHACVIFSRDEHGMWCNLEALSALGLGGEAPRILRDAEMSEKRAKGCRAPIPASCEQCFERRSNTFTATAFVVLMRWRQTVISSMSWKNWRPMMSLG